MKMIKEGYFYSQIMIPEGSNPFLQQITEHLSTSTAFMKHQLPSAKMAKPDQWVYNSALALLDPPQALPQKVKIRYLSPFEGFLLA